MPVWNRKKVQEVLRSDVTAERCSSKRANLHHAHRPAPASPDGVADRGAGGRVQAGAPPTGTERQRGKQLHWKCERRRRHEHANQRRGGHDPRERAELEAWLVVRGEAPGPLFCAVRKGGAPKTGAPLAESGIAWILSRLARLAEIAHVSPHDIRRTFVGDLLDAGADLAIVQRLAGYAQVSTTQRYDRRGERAAAKAAALLSVPRLA